MSKDKAPRKYYGNWMSLESSFELAKDCTPKAEWCDIQCFVEEQAYDALESKLAECMAALEEIKRVSWDCAIRDDLTGLHLVYEKTNEVLAKVKK